MRWLVTLGSFALMIGASIWVVADHWPPGGMPALPLAAHLAATATVLLETVTRAFKMKASADACGYRLRFPTALRACLGGDLAAALTPARSGAEPARFLILAESGMPHPGRVLVLFLELALEMCSLAVVCTVLALLFRGRGASAVGLLSLVVGYSGVVIAIATVATVLARRDSEAPPRWLARLGVRGARWSALRSTLRATREAVGALRRANGWRMSAAFAGSVVHVLCKVATLPLLVFIGDPSFTLSMDTLAPLVLWPLALFYGGVVVPAPGGGGFIEGAFAATLSSAIPAGMFAAALLWWRFYTFYLYLVAGGIAAGSAVARAIARRGLPDDGAPPSPPSSPSLESRG